MPVKAVARSIPSAGGLVREGVRWYEANLLTATSLDRVLGHGDIVCNLAYMADADESANVAMIDKIIEACWRANVSRMVHCSTAVVSGAARSLQIRESDACMPVGGYEKTKWVLERRVLASLREGFDVGILRPTAIVGPGGENLLKLATSLQSGKRALNYLRASVLRNRPMHLVSVRDVTAALLHLVGMPIALGGNIYHVSADDDVNNDYERIEAILLRSLGLPARRVPLLPIPDVLRSLVFGMMGRSELTIRSKYDSRKLLDTGFKSTDSVANAVFEFGAALRTGGHEDKTLSENH